MATYSFEAITAAQALAIAPADLITVAATTGSSTGATALYLGDGTISLALGAQTVVFGSNLSALSATSGHLSFNDGSTLYIGDATANLASTGNDTHNAALFGGAGDDTLTATGAHSLLQGNAGADRLTGSAGADTIYGGQDNDVIVTGNGVNFAQGNKGDDNITGGSDLDTLLGGQGDDTITGGGGADFLNGNLGNDSVSGHGQLFGEDGNDTLVSGPQGHDTIDGGAGNDSIQADTGADIINGGDGDDTISALGGAHSILGGAGADHFMFGANSLTPGAVTQIQDWSRIDDRLDFIGFTPNPDDIASGMAADYAAAVAFATTSVTQTHFSFVEVQVGANLYVFAGASGGLSSVVELIGRGLLDFSGANLI